MKNHVVQSSRSAPPVSFVLAGLAVAIFAACSARAASVTLGWERNTETNLAGYRLCYGTASRSYSGSVSAGASATNATVSNLLAGQTYYFAVAASNTAGLLGAYSSEVSCTTPATNLAPVANAQSVTTAADTAKAITLTGSDADGNPLTYAVVTSPTHGALSGAAPNLTYTPAGSYTGSDSFAFRVNDGVANSATADVAITVLPATNPPPALQLPAPWVTADIGSGAIAGNVSVTNNSFTVNGAGIIGGVGDHCRYVYQPMNGNGEIRVRLSAAQLGSSNALAGVMIRETLNSGARSAFLGLAPDSTVRFVARYLTGNSATTENSPSSGPPAWLRLVRSDTTFVAYQSSDGKKWSRLSSSKIVMAANVYVGFAVGSGTTDTLGRATFDLFTVVP